MNARVVLFLTVVPLVWLGLHYYIGRRLVGAFELGRRHRFIAWTAVAVLAVMPVLSFVGTRLFGVLGTRPMQWLGFLLMGVSSILFLLLVTADLVRGGTAVVAWLRRRVAAPDPDAADADPQRRAFLGRAVNLGIIGSAAAATTAGAVGAARLPSIVEVDVPIEGLPAALHGYRIVQITDVHVGPTIRGEYLDAVVAMVNEQEPDLVAVTGDLIDGWVEELAPEVAALAELQGRDGAYFVTGNHEYYWNGPAWCEQVERCGLTVLKNQHRVIERDGARILLAGVTDYSAGAQAKGHATDPHKARKGAPEHDVSILLAHQPRSIYEAAKAGYDLQISGHTHGGQYFPITLLAHLAQPYVAGLHRHEDTWIYVSRGTGYWGPPIRLGAPHEVTVLRLVPA